MPPRLLTTKLHITRPRANLVSRERLLARLDAALQRGHKLTLISAPAGFGKTTLVSSWISDFRLPISDFGFPMDDTREANANPKSKIQNRVAWLSLDEADSDPTRFLIYLVAALQTAMPGVGEGALGMLQSPQQPPTEAILTALINEIATVPENSVLVLDDYHVIEAQAVDAALTFLLDHLPPQLHLVIATRADPVLPLSRLRARGKLTELRAAELRFTPAEATEFLNQMMGLDLSTEEVTALEARTEGWIAGLQLAALSMQGRRDTARFIQAFAGSHRYVLDYLVEEVLQRQPQHIRDFLLQTAILDRLSGSLCEAVTQQSDGKRMLEMLERANLFVVPLDDERRWYRYHHLFTDVLLARLMEEQPNHVPALHRRASAWYEQHDLRYDAIRHALAAGDVEVAARLAELAWSSMFRTYFQNTTFLGWMEALPDELIRARPVLGVGYAWALLDIGELEAAEARLRDAERWLETTVDVNERSETPRDGMVVVDEAAFRALPAIAASARAYIALALGDTSGAVKHARRMLNLVPETDYYLRGSASALLGGAYWRRGDLEAAYNAMADGINWLQKMGNVAFSISGTVALADIRVTQGRLRDAIRAYESSLRLAEAQEETVLQGVASLHLGLSELYWELGEPDVARQHLLRSEALGEQAGLVDWPYRLRLVQARIAESEGDLDGALDLLHEAERLYIRSPLPDVCPLTAIKARVWVRQGRLAEALGWAQERGLTADDELSYMREFEHVTLVRVLIARQADDAVHKALGLLERLLQAADAGVRTGSVIEILVLQALAHQAQGHTPRALASLERALTLAKPEGYVRVFVDEGPPMAALLREAAKHDIAPDYVRRLHAAFEPGDISPPTPQPLIEPLTDREQDVLRWLQTDLSGPDIARELTVSLNTLRTHTKNIYSKLSVHSRRAAVRCAEELGLL